MKIILGSGPKAKQGYVNVDGLEWEGKTDIIHDLATYPYPFGIGMAEEIIMIEVLEHISFRETHNVLKECLRILKDRGKLHIQVPDCGAMMKAYAEDKIDKMIPHKGDETMIRSFQKKTGKIVHPDRFLYAFTGAQKHQYDTHQNVFWKERLEEEINKAGFNRVDFIEDKLGWKLKCNCYK